MKPPDKSMGTGGWSRAMPPRDACPCPICGRRALKAYRPFCSRRCADVDLGRWLGERYFIAGPPSASADEPPPE